MADQDPDPLDLPDDTPVQDAELTLWNPLTNETVTISLSECTTISDLKTAIALFLAPTTRPC